MHHCWTSVGHHPPISLHSLSYPAWHCWWQKRLRVLLPRAGNYNSTEFWWWRNGFSGDETLNSWWLSPLFAKQQIKLPPLPTFIANQDAITSQSKARDKVPPKKLLAACVDIATIENADYDCNGYCSKPQWLLMNAHDFQWCVIITLRQMGCFKDAAFGVWKRISNLDIPKTV